MFNHVYFIYSRYSPAQLCSFRLLSLRSFRLRLKIWKLLPEPRNVEVRFSLDGRNNHYKFVGGMPTVPHICPESRHEALKWYKLKFVNHRNINSVYFNNSLDSLYISRWGGDSQKFLFVKWNLESLMGLERLYLSDRTLYQILGKNITSRQSIGSFPFPALKEIRVLATGRGVFHQHSASCVPYKSCFRIIEEVKRTCPNEEELVQKIKKSKGYIAEFEAWVEERVQKGFTWEKPTFVHMALCEGGVEAGRGFPYHVGV
jgi:hypothetical protein